MFMHGGWLHLIGNMWYMKIFADNIEDNLGPEKFYYFLYFVRNWCSDGASFNGYTFTSTHDWS